MMLRQNGAAPLKRQRSGSSLAARRSVLGNASLLGLIGYLSLAIILLARTWFGGQLDQRLAGGGSDPLGLVWFLAWLPHALGSGHSPLFTTLLMAPEGANLLNSTAISLPALLLWPVTATLGPTISYDVMATLALTLSAWAAYFALRRVTRYSSSAWIGGALYGFGGYMTGQATAHANLMVAVFPPIVALLLADARHTRTPIKTGVLLGLSAVAQVFINEEILATTAIMAALALLFAIWTQRPTRAIVMRYARVLGAAAVAFTLLAGPALLYQLFGPQHVSGVLVRSGRYVNDLAGFVIPNSTQWLSTAGSRHLTSGFSGYDGEWGSYLGLPLISLLIWTGWRLRRRALPAGLLLICAAIFSLGPHLRVLGHDTGLYLPWIIPNHLPLLENAVPDRFNLFIWLAVAVLLVQLTDEMRSRAPSGHRAVGIGACVLALVPVLPTLAPSELVTVPAVIGNAVAFRRAAPNAKTVLITPMSNGQFAMYAQAKADFAYSIPAGGVFVPSPNGPSYGMRQGPLLYALASLGGQASTQAGRTSTDALCLGQISHSTTLSDRCRSHYLHALRALHVDAVIVCNLRSRAGERYARFFTSLLGSPQPREGTLIFPARVVAISAARG